MHKLLEVDGRLCCLHLTYILILVVVVVVVVLAATVAVVMELLGTFDVRENAVEYMYPSC